jgi:hypothetical protein
MTTFERATHYLKCAEQCRQLGNVASDDHVRVQSQAKAETYLAMARAEAQHVANEIQDAEQGHVLPFYDKHRTCVIRRNDGDIGPFFGSTVMMLLKTKMVRPTDLVSCDGLPHWISVDDLKSMLSL